MHRNIKYLSLGIISIGAALLYRNPALAANYDPSVSLEKISEDSTLADLHPTVDHPAPGKYTATYRLTASNVKGYAIYASTTDDNLVGQKDANNKIPSMGNAQAASVGAIEANTWGFRASFDSEPTNYYTGVPVLAAEYQENKDNLLVTAKYIGGATVPDNTPVSKDIYLDVATKIDASQPSDTYKGTVVLSAIATPADATIFDINSMQQMTPEICESTLTPTPTASIPALDGSDSYGIPITDRTGRKNLVYDANNRTTVNGQPRTTIATETFLMDERDEKLYLVAKLADGRCWMIQNLALTSGNTEDTRRIITYENSDITVENLPAALSNMGEAGRYKLPVSDVTGFTVPDNGFMYNGSYRPNSYSTQGFAANASYPNGIPAAGQGECKSNSSAGCNGSNSGSYYSWKVATVGSTNSTTQYDNAPASICPKGWKIPASSDRASDNPEFQALYNAYGSYDMFSNIWHTSSPSASFSGYIYYGELNSSGVDTIWWSSTVYSDKYAYSVDQNISSFNLTNDGNRSGGSSVRCVAR